MSSLNPAQMAQLQALLSAQQNAAASSLMEFRAGIMDLRLENGVKTLFPDPRKGKVVFVMEDSILRLHWLTRPQESKEIELMLFPQSATFEIVNECKDGTVFVLKYKDSSSRKFFWSQEPPPKEGESDKTPAEIVRKVNDLINNPPPDPMAGGDFMGRRGARSPPAAAAAPANSSNQTQAQMLQSFLQNMRQNAPATPAAAPAAPAASTAPTLPSTAAAAPTPSRPAEGSNSSSSSNTSSASTQQTPGNRPASVTSNAPARPTQPSSGGPLSSASIVQQLLATAQRLQLQQQSDAAAMEEVKETRLSDILNAERVLAALDLENNPQLLAELAEHLPPEQRSLNDIGAHLRSPQIRQALARLNSLLYSEQFPSLMQSLSLPIRHDSSIGVQEFLNAIQNLADKEKNKDKK